MEKVRVLIHGKINLSLNITGKTGNMHLIDSVMQSVSFGDYITATARQDSRVKITFTGEGAEFIDKNNNSVQKTVEYLQNIFGDFGVEMVIEKGIPLSGGMGGSSADAAGALVALNRLYDFDKRGLNINHAAAALGSDVSFMITGGCARVTGTGEKIQHLPNNLPLYIVAAHAAAGVNSRDAYTRFDLLYPSFTYNPADNDKLINFLNKGDAAALNFFKNALHPASQSLCGRIDKVRDALLNAGAIAAVMTGSGGCVVGFYKGAEIAESAAADLTKQGFWAKSCHSTNTGISGL